MTRKLFTLLLFLLTFSLAAQQTPYAGAIAIPGTLQAENFDNGGEGVAWHDTTAGNLFGSTVYRNTDVDVGQIPSGGFHVGAVEAAEWTEYTVNIASAGTYTVTLRWASAYTGSTTFRLQLDNVVIANSTQSVTSTGDWQAYTTKTFNIDLNSTSTHILKVDFLTGHWNFDSMQFTKCPAPVPAKPNAVTSDPNLDVTFSTSNVVGWTYQWLKNGVPIAVTATNGANTPTLTVKNVEQYKDGANYSVKVTTGCGLSATTGTALLRVRCGTSPGKPGWVEANIGRALNPDPNGPGDLCDWPSNVNTNFPYDITFAGSYNIAPLAAAVAYVKEPVRAGVWDMNTWWSDYLAGELGDRGNVWYFGGKEFGSYVYQEYNETAVLAVHYMAHVRGNTALENLAKRWLRAAIGLHAIAASSSLPATLHANGLAINVTTPYTGPYTAFAGDRSGWGFWTSPQRNILLAQGAGIFWSGNNTTETTAQSTTRGYIEQGWIAGGFPVVAAYGMSSTDASNLTKAINTDCLPPSFVSSFLGSNLRTLSRYHVVAWSGVKATLMETSNNNNTAPTFGAVYFSSSREAHFLYPWGGVFDGNSSQDRNGICNGTATLDLAGHTMSASHPDCFGGQAAQSATINYLPSTTVKYHVILDPNAAPTATTTSTCQ
ncbi:MAG: hypothetical protein DMF56_16250 [Acidobacteria bacterium]|nr:MAG: hypothetical protein DMF56_16250 [Acidobacteriota bacterium]